MNLDDELFEAHEFGGEETSHIKHMLEECEEALALDSFPFTRYQREFLQKVLDEFYAHGSISVEDEKTLKRIWSKI